MNFAAPTVVMALCVATSYSQDCVPSWPIMFPESVSGFVRVLADSDDAGNPRLYAAGDFDFIDGVSADNVAMYDGRQWSAMAEGLNAAVYGLTVVESGPDGPSVYAGGLFTKSGETDLNFVARWDGASWLSIGAGLPMPVKAIALFDDGTGPRLYAGAKSSGETAVWDGATWSISDTHSGIESLTVFDDGDGAELYAGGSFYDSGELVGHIAKWDGKGWSPLPVQPDGKVLTLQVHDDGSGTGPALFAGGEFTNIGGLIANHIAKWDGKEWSSLGTGVSVTSSSDVRCLASRIDDAGAALIVGGSFASTGGVLSKNIAAWDGKEWSGLDEGLYGTVGAVASFSEGAATRVFAGWEYDRKLAYWDNDEWIVVGNGLGGQFPQSGALPSVSDLATFDDGSGSGPALYVGGMFTYAGQVQCRSLARWDGRVWSALPDDLFSPPSNESLVRALAVVDAGSGLASGLYVGGWFAQAGDLTVNSMARWDGSQWSALGTGISGGYVEDIVVFDDGLGGGPALYATGTFTSAGGQPANKIAKWDGANWSALGSGLSDIGWALEVFDDGDGPALYVGGTFTSAGGVSANRIARWHGQSWSSLGAGLADGTPTGVYALASYSPNDDTSPALYVGGEFKHAGGIDARNIAKWNGQEWAPVGDGVTPYVLAMKVMADGLDTPRGLYLGGLIVEAGGFVTGPIVRWNGTFWTPVAQEDAIGQPYLTAGYIFAFERFDDGNGPALHVGGQFSKIDGMPAGNLAKWSSCPIDGLPNYTVCEYDADEITVAPQCGSCSPPNLTVGDINESGMVIGKVGPQTLFKWTANNGVVLEAVPSALQYNPRLNDLGDIAATFSVGSVDTVKVQIDGTWMPIPVKEPFVHVEAVEINNARQVLCVQSSSLIGVQPFVWQGGVYTDITSPQGASAFANDLNEAGQVAGSTWVDGLQRGYVWTSGQLTLLDPLPGHERCAANGLNDNGQVVGWSQAPEENGSGPDPVRHAVLWDHGRPIDLGVLPDHRDSIAWTINDRGEIGGGSRMTPSSSWVSFIYQDGVMQLLEDLAPMDVSVGNIHAINNPGQILCDFVDVIVLSPVAHSIADINGDCDVDMDDLILVIYEWGESPSDADIDGSGVVDIDDLFMLLAIWEP